MPDISLKNMDQRMFRGNSCLFHQQIRDEKSHQHHHEAGQISRYPGADLAEHAFAGMPSERESLFFRAGSISGKPGHYNGNDQQREPFPLQIFESEISADQTKHENE